MSREKTDIPFWLLPLGFVECFSELGVKRNELLENARLPKALLLGDRYFISQAQQIALIESGIELCPLSRPGLRVGLSMPWCFYGELANIVETSPSVKEAGAAFRRYTTIAQPHHREFMARIDFYLANENKLFLPLFSPYGGNVPSEVKQFDFDYRLVITLRLLHSTGYDGDDHAGLTLYLKDRRKIPVSLEDLLPVKAIHYGYYIDGISGGHRFFLEEWRTARKQLFEQAIGNCERAYRQARLYDSIEDLVRWHVDMSFIRGIKLETVAEILKTTPRTLNRKLSERGTSFREIVHQSKMSNAMRHLKYSEMSTVQIANVLGYSSESSLCRAVKNWSGLKLSELRSSVQGRFYQDICEGKEAKQG